MSSSYVVDSDKLYKQKTNILEVTDPLHNFGLHLPQISTVLPKNNPEKVIYHVGIHTVQSKGGQGSTLSSRIFSGLERRLAYSS